MDLIKYSTTLDNKSIIERCDNICNRTNFYYNDGVYFQNVKNNFDTLSDWPHLWPEFKEFVENLNILTNNQPILKSWFNILNKDSLIRSHCHSRRAKKYVCVYYPQCDDSHPPFEYFNFTTRVWEKVICNTGDYILFDNTTYHRVGQQISITPRYSITFNI